MPKAMAARTRTPPPTAPPMIGPVWELEGFAVPVAVDIVRVAVLVEAALAFRVNITDRSAAP
jgi:hypothetical protein